MFTKKYFSNIKCAILPLYRNRSKSCLRFSVGEQKKLKDAIQCHERFDLLFGKHSTVHKAQNLAESRSSDVHSPKSRNEFE